MTARISGGAVASLLIGVVLIVGIGLTGATIDSTEQVGGPNETELEMPDEEQTPNSDQRPDGELDNESGVTPAGPSDSGSTEGLSRCIEGLNSTPGTLAVVVAFLAIVGFVFYRYNFSAALLVGWTVLPPVALGYFLMTNCGGGGTETSDGQNPVPGGGSPLDIAPNIPPWLLLGAAGLLLFGAVGLMYRTMGEETVVTVEEETEEDADLDEFAEAAGRAADRIEEHDADVDNAVYQAWVEMTDLIDVENPDSYSPGEFAATAVDLGMAESDVTELTRLFNEVRYGDRDAETREERALAVLRNIESEYGTADDASSAGATDGTDADGTDDDGSDTTTDDGDDEV